MRRAVRFSLLTGATTVAAAAIPAHAQDQAATADASAEEIVVTGSRIRRVDAETASPVFVIDADTIAQSGATTLGEVLTEIPAISGAATNPQVNNGGGDGATNIELRGLGVDRTLVLLNGRRIGALGQVTNAVDVNAIPVNMIERVDVLKEGAGAIYGSDAIGGVVNFITKKNFDGAELGLDFGVSGEDDGERKQVALSWGTQGDRGNIGLGFTWNQQDAVSAADREFSRNALYFYGSVFEGGSSRAPTGRISLDAALEAQYGCASITRIDGTAGDSPDDFRCFQTTGDTDFYNFQPENLLLTPQERGNLFALANYEVADGLELYTEAFFNYTTSGYAIAPLPFDARNDNVIISADSIYNPFGIDFGGGEQPDGSLNPNALFRMEALGRRRSKTDTNQGHINVGLRGDLFKTEWKWDAAVSYGRIDQDWKIDGYLFKPALANAFGPSFIAANGTPTCGTPTAPIQNCTPVNIFNLGDPAQLAALNTIAAGYTQNFKYQGKGLSLNLTGDVFELPAGDLQAAVGYEFRDQDARFDTDFMTQATPPLFKDCLLAGETCSGDSSGSYDVSDVYAEFLIPVVKDAPFAQAINLNVGVRYSDYSTFGDTTNGAYKLEWRPMADLLVRGSFSDVFRAPTINDMFRAPTANAATFNDPCVGLTSADVAANPNLALACQNVPQDGSFSQANSQVDGLFRGNTSLVPEEGEVVTYGFVYQPSQVRGLELSVDVWDYSLDNVITAIDVNTVAEQCAATGQAQFCGLINRFSDGQILQIQQPTVNLGTLETNGIDFGVKYLMRGTSFGDFRFGLDATHTESYENTPAPGAQTVEVAGTYDRQFGNYAKWRGMGSVGWTFGPFNALAVARYIDSIELVDPDGAPGIQPNLQIGSRTYLDLTLGFDLESTKTKFRIGVNNLTDKDPPILYQNNVTNANTDVSTYDTVGRYIWASVVQKF